MKHKVNYICIDTHPDWEDNYPWIVSIGRIGRNFEDKKDIGQHGWLSNSFSTFFYVTPSSISRVARAIQNLR